ncbi:hypothetical protein [Pseudomonas protegens]|uniref:hypothetical protein n=1 Tax=Pseudomonas protegens TaxID=380021 RepID=UPI0011B1D64D|nr:hypothetical protein [Pseudomonas protegens]
MLEKDELLELQATDFVGLTVGVGSQILLFSNGSAVMLQCPFECEGKGGVALGYGESVLTAVLLFEFLNERLMEALFDDGILTLVFGGGGRIRVIPDRNGLESYVVCTRHGVCPIMVF